MSKSALDQFTRCAAIDLIQYGVRVNSVSPGGVTTGFGEAMGMPSGAFEEVNIRHKFLEFFEFSDDEVYGVPQGVHPFWSCS